MRMNVFWSGIFKMVAQILGQIVVNVSPGLVVGLKDFLVLQYLKALETENPWDDFFFGMLLDILSVPRPPPA
jgi:hypothetical protein